MRAAGMVQPAPMRHLLLCVSLFTVIACGGGAPEDIERICVAATECGALTAAQTDRCIAELDGATPDSASRAAAECAECVDTKTCGEVSSGACVQSCAPLKQTINAVPGTVTGGCTSSSTGSFAAKSYSGDLLMQIDCATDFEIVISPYFDTVGSSKPCGKFRSSEGASCPTTSTGTVAIIERDGRRWAKGTCSCSGVSVTFDLPFRISF
ncbi:MAG: hypothetical protein JWP01_1180 [Myxococcales bacterium]|nr:hypothetical protein [Myxococcales bacterium]